MATERSDSSRVDTMQHNLPQTDETRRSKAGLQDRASPENDKGVAVGGEVWFYSEEGVGGRAGEWDKEHRDSSRDTKEGVVEVVAGGFCSGVRRRPG